MTQCQRTGKTSAKGLHPATAAADGSDPSVTLSSPRSLQITETVQIVLRANLRRRYLCLQNQSLFAWRYMWDLEARPGFGSLLSAGRSIILRGEDVPGGALYIVGDIATAPGYPGPGVAIEG